MKQQSNEPDVQNMQNETPEADVTETARKRRFKLDIEENVMAICFAIMCIVTFVNVVTRYIFSYTFSWAEQLTRIMFVWLTLSGISYCGYKKAHLKVTALELAMPKKAFKILLIVGDTISVVFGFAMSFVIFDIVKTIIERGQHFPSMPWMPAWVMYIPGVIFMFTFALRVIQAGIIPTIKELKEMKGKEA